MLRIVLTRALLVALPFIVWFAWREIARRQGREVGATPYPWLFAIGMVIAGLSLMATVAFRQDTRGETYVPAQAEPGGRVRPSEFVPQAPHPPPAPTAPNTAP